MVDAKQAQGFGHFFDGLRITDAEQLAGYASRVSERPQHVEHSADTDFPAHRRYVTHGRMVGRRKHEADTDFPQAAFHGLRGQFDAHAQRFQHVGAAASTGRGPIAVLGDGEAGAGHDESGGSGDVERSLAVAPGANDVDGRAVRADAQGLLSHHRGETGDFLRRFALERQRGQIGSQLSRRGFALHDFAHHLDGIVHGQGFAGHRRGYGFTNHLAPRFG